FGGSNGFNMFDPAALPEAQHVPPIVLTSFEKLNEPADTERPHELLDSVALDYRDDVVSFEFAALDFVAPDKNRYAYRLRGFDREWVDLGNRRRITYTNLDSDNYVLEVRAASSDGVWNQAGLSLPVSVAPAPWETVWAYAAYVAAALLLAALLFRQHRRKLQSEARHSRRLEREVKDRTAELEQRNKQLLEANHAKSQFLARMSHEIRTPMNGVLGMTELLRGTGLNDKQQRFANTIHNSAKSLLEIINDILDFSKIEAGKLQLEEVEFDAIDLIEDAAELLAGPAAEKGLELICGTPPDHVPRVVGDPLRIRQILINLIGNAIKFTDRGEVIARFATVKESKDAVELKFEVEDSGVGISEANQSLIFDCFSQEDGSTTRRYGGTGLGLAISKQLVDLMHGDIGVESSPGVGSTFWFTIRLKKARSLAPIRWSAQSLKDMRVMIVDGNATHQRVLEEQLAAWQVDAHGVTDPAAALEALQRAKTDQEPYDVVIVDINSPKFDGESLVRRIREAPRLGDVKLILMSSVAADSGQPSTEREATSCLTKPVRQSALYDALVQIGSCVKAHKTTDRTGSHETKIGAGARILLVEDNPVNQEVAIGMLKLLGCRIETVADGHAAVKRVAAQCFDLVLMDCQMPVMDGFEASRAIRGFEAETGRQRVPIVAVTAGALEGDRERCLESGMDDHLSKPYTLQALYRTLKQWLPAELTRAGSPDSATIDAGELLDQTALDNIRSLERSGNPRMLSRVIELYLANSAELMTEMKKAFNADDPERVARSAHTLKSSSANLGAMAFAEVCRVLEAESRSGDLVESSGLYRQLDNLYPKVVQALKSELQSKSA
ncbi:MAG: response regulator, partial [Gammaproteobacteria bacterium]|nr:response regulator [Gammaproteobacteria bacterium]